MLKRMPAVFLVDGDASLREFLTGLFESSGYRVQAAGTPEEFLASYEEEAPGCLLLALELPGMNGLDLWRETRRRGGRHPVVIISADGTVPIVVDAMRSGVMDFIPKPLSHDYLLLRIREAVHKDALERVRYNLRQSVLRRMNSLTPRETEILEGVVGGSSSKQIAGELGISPKTVEVHRANLVRKMEAGSVAQLVHLVHVIRNAEEEWLEQVCPEDI